MSRISVQFNPYNVQKTKDLARIINPTVNKSVLAATKDWNTREGYDMDAVQLGFDTYQTTRVPENGFGIYNNGVNPPFQTLISTIDKYLQPLVHKRNLLSWDQKAMYDGVASLVGFHEPYSLENYNKLFLTRVADHFATLGIIPTFIVAYRKDLGEYAFSVSGGSFWGILGLEDATFNTLSGKTLTRPFAITLPFSQSDIRGFAACEAAFMYGPKIEKEIKAQLETYKQVSSSYLITMPFKDIHNTERIKQQLFTDKDEQGQIKTALILSYIKLLHDWFSTDPVPEVKASFVLHEQQHNENSHLDPLICMKRKTGDVAAEIIWEYWGRLNELNGAPRFRMLELIEHALFKAKPYDLGDVVNRGLTTAEALMLRDVVSVVLESPQKYGVEVFDNSNIQKYVQVLAQLDKLVRVPGDIRETVSVDRPQELLKALKSYCNDGNVFMARYSFDTTSFYGSVNGLLPEFYTALRD